jgi:hypothetical protein
MNTMQILKNLSGAFLRKMQGSKLFDGDDALFREIVTAKGGVYGEYGCGQSTVWMSRNFRGKILSVDTSEYWAQRTSVGCDGAANVKVHWANLGPVGEWGRPVDYAHGGEFADYTDWIWRQNEKPNYVLIDGRFRVCCFLTTLLYAAPGTVVFFDDYTDRPHYHFIERFLEPKRICGRQAMFEIPLLSAETMGEVRLAVDHFRYVME